MPGTEPAPKKDNVETLDFYVDRALEFFEAEGDYSLELPESRLTAVAGSQNGYWTGRLLYRLASRPFADAEEVQAIEKIESLRRELDDVTIVSATGSRNVIPIAEYALRNGIRVNAVTCKRGSDMEEAFGKDIHIIHVPAINEPPTINAATYGRMIEGVTHEDIGKIRGLVRGLPDPQRFGIYGAFTLLFPDSMLEVSRMADWKCMEIFGRHIGARAANYTQMMHGGGVLSDPEELYISIGVENSYFPRACHKTASRLHIPVPKGFGPLGHLMAAYSVIGRIQRFFPQFQEQIMGYKEESRGWEWQPRE